MSDTNLTAKFTAIETQLTTQHGELKSRLDTIIDKLDALNTTLTNNGAFDATPIVDAINGLRGNSAETTNDTLYSLNKSIWNLAGTAPGSSLLQIYDEIVALRGTGGPETTLRSINESLWNLAGPAPGAALSDLKSILQKVVDTLGDPSSIAPLYITVRGLLDDIRNQWASGAGLSAYNLLDSHYLLQVQLLEQFNTAVVVPTMKDLLMTISQQQALLATNTANPLHTVPTDCCATPLTNIGSFFQDTTAGMVTPVTFALWPQTPGGEFTSSYDITMDGYVRLHCTNWTAYRIYVASKSDTFGVITGRGNRYPCNQWVTLDIPEFINTGAAFNVDRANDLKVYICPIAPLGSNPSICAGSGDPDYTPIVVDFQVTDWTAIGSFTEGGAEYTNYAPVYPLVSGVLEMYQGDYTPNAGSMLTSPSSYWEANPLIERIVLCIEWDFTGATVYPAYSIDAIGALHGPFSAQGGYALETISSQRITLSKQTDYYSLPVAGIVFAAPAAAGMPSNVWITARSTETLA